MRKEIVVTGIGMVTPLGLNVKETWRSLSNGANGIARIQRFDPTGFPVRFAAEVPSFELEPFEKLSPLSQTILSSLKGKLTYKAVKEALYMSGLDTVSERVGVAVGSEASRPHLEELAAQIDQQRIPSAETLRAMSPQAPVDLIREITGLKGPSSVISTACTSSSQAVGEGLLRIRRGEVDAMIVGGVDVLVDPIMVTGFSLLGALSTRNEEPSLASRPFDVERDGFVLGEGAGFLILEERDFAVRRSAPILGKISGYGCSCNAYRITDSPPDGRGAAQSMEAALRDAQLAPDAIGYINAHGTSTKMNDTSETRGVYRAFGNAAQSVSVSSTKSMMGHLVAACGAVEAIVALQAVRTSVLPPTRNLENIDPECRLNHVRGTSDEKNVDHAITNAFGFGGSNGSLVLSKWA